MTQAILKGFLPYFTISAPKNSRVLLSATSYSTHLSRIAVDDPINGFQNLFIVISRAKLYTHKKNKIKTLNKKQKYLLYFLSPTQQTQTNPKLIIIESVCKKLLYHLHQYHSHKLAKCQSKLITK